MPSPSLRELLSHGDRRSIGRVPEVLTRLRARPRLAGAVVALIRDPDPRIAMRAADALEKFGRERWARLQPFKRALLALLRSPQQDVQWHLAQILPRLQLTRQETHQAFVAFEAYLDSPSSIVRTNAVQALAELGGANPTLVVRARTHVAWAARTGTPAMRARARRLAARLRPPLDRGITTA